MFHTVMRCPCFAARRCPHTEMQCSCCDTRLCRPLLRCTIRYIRSTLGLPVPLAKTGVKFVHHAATVYDIGMYVPRIAPWFAVIMFENPNSKRAC